MTQPTQNRTISDALELLQTNGFDELAQAVEILMNTAMSAERSQYLGAAPYERSPL